MPTIRELKLKLTQAVAEGKINICAGALSALEVQRMALQSRSKHASLLAMRAHCFVIEYANKSGLSSAELLELGSIVRTSMFYLKQQNNLK